MSTKSRPGDGSHGKGCKGMPAGEPRRKVVTVLRDLTQGVRTLRHW